MCGPELEEKGLSKILQKRVERTEVGGWALPMRESVGSEHSQKESKLESIRSGPVN